MQKYIRATDWVEINDDEGVPKGAVFPVSEISVWDYDLTNFELIECDPKDLELNFGVWRVRRDRTAKVIPWEDVVKEELYVSSFQRDNKRGNHMDKEGIMKLYWAAESEWLRLVAENCSEEAVSIARVTLNAFAPNFEKILEKGIDK